MESKLSQQEQELPTVLAATCLSTRPATSAGKYLVSMFFIACNVDCSRLNGFGNGNFLEAIFEIDRSLFFRNAKNSASDIFLTQVGFPNNLVEWKFLAP